MQRAPLHERTQATARGPTADVRRRGLGLQRLESRGCNDPAWTRGSPHLPGSGTSHHPPWPSISAAPSGPSPNATGSVHLSQVDIHLAPKGPIHRSPRQRPGESAGVPMSPGGGLQRPRRRECRAIAVARSLEAPLQGAGRGDAFPWALPRATVRPARWACGQWTVERNGGGGEAGRREAGDGGLWPVAGWPDFHQEDAVPGGLAPMAPCGYPLEPNSRHT